MNNLAVLNRAEKEIHILKENSELRFEVSEKSHVLIEVLEGNFELFGSELVANRSYSLHPGTKGAIFTFQGGKVKLIGNVEFAYVSTDTPVDAYFKFALSLEQLRIKASREKNPEQKKKLVPRVVVIGPTDSGKSTLCRYLTNYSVRFGRTPILVDLDVGQNSISVPGTIASLLVERPADPTADGFDRDGNLVFHYGHTSVVENTILYTALIQRMAMCVDAKIQADERADLGGLIINTCGWNDSIKHECFHALIETIKSFEATVVVVMESERLYHDLKKEKLDFVKIIRLPKSKGVVTRSTEVRKDLRWSNFKNYYYGRLQLSEHQELGGLRK